MKNLGSAKYYALAFYPFIEERFEEIIDKMKGISALLISEGNIAKFLNHPAFSYAKKMEVASNIFKSYADSQIDRLLFVLIRKQKIVILSSILDELKKLHAKYQGIEAVTISSSQELSDEDKKSLLSKISTSVNKKVFAEYIIDKKLISGLIIKVGDRKIDYSLKGKLKGLKEMVANIHLAQ